MANNECKGGCSSKEIAALEKAIKSGVGHATAKAEAFKGKEGVSKPDNQFKKGK